MHNKLPSTPKQLAECYVADTHYRDVGNDIKKFRTSFSAVIGSFCRNTRGVNRQKDLSHASAAKNLNDIKRSSLQSLSLNDKENKNDNIQNKDEINLGYVQQKIKNNRDNKEEDDDGYEI
ncbi:unnamed protein product [Didymodactylos carnosus]|uniref:Uncharacterized protein n=1 Tax=Didymodactylos carnosus TaxID=1234261 RepID=A0A815TEK8_9BILA|nr:unnamed protein product [Didymodactylos carnosus]CAF4364267.1 unnamed protein product [Didymodactylos carnosus]